MGKVGNGNCGLKILKYLFKIMKIILMYLVKLIKIFIWFINFKWKNVLEYFKFFFEAFLMVEDGEGKIFRVLGK